MKSYFNKAVVGLALVASVASGCTEAADQKVVTLFSAADDLEFAKNEATELCFAAAQSSTAYNYNIIASTHVECTPAVMKKIIYKDPQKAFFNVNKLAFRVDSEMGLCFAVASSQTSYNRLVQAPANIPCNDKVLNVISVKTPDDVKTYKANFPARK